MNLTRRGFISGLAAAIAATVVPPVLAQFARSDTGAAVIGLLRSERRPDLGYLWQHIVSVEIGGREFQWAEFSDAKTISAEEIAEIRQACRGRFGRDMEILVGRAA